MAAKFVGVELARVGTFDASTGKVTLTAHDFAHMVSAFAELKSKYGFPLKLGHDNGQPLLKTDGLPAAGWIDNLRVDGDRLVADLIEVPDGIARLINQKLYRTRSIEFHRNVLVAGKRYPIVLTACALLGEQLPAVDSLADIAALYTAASLVPFVAEESEPVAALATSTDEQTNEEGELAEIIGELLGALEKAEGKIHGKQGAPALRSLVATTLRELKRVASGQFRKELSMDKVIEKLQLKAGATEDEILAAINALAAAKPEEKPEEKPEDNAAFVALKKENDENAKKILQLEQAAALSAATTSVDDAIKEGKFLPASRDTLIKMAAGSPDTFAELVKSTPAKSALLSGELGTSRTSADGGKAGDFDPAAFEPTEAEMQVALAMGNTRETVIRQKAEDAGIKVPESFGKSETGETERLASAIAAAIKAANTKE